jgi:hypothetical protein
MLLIEQNINFAVELAAAASKSGSGLLSLTPLILPHAFLV